MTRNLPDRSSSEPQLKRHKSENGTELSTILARATSNTYSSLDDVLEDIDSAVHDFVDKLELTNGTPRNQYSQPDPVKNNLSLKASAFRSRAHQLVENHKASIRQTTTVGHSSGGNVDSKSLITISAKTGETKSMLTLYGNAPAPRQLFSSLQIPIKVAGEDQNVIQPLQEAGLPTGITTTQIVPIHSTSLFDEKKRTQTLGELFPTSSTLPALQPPKASKIATTRSSNVGWYQPASADSQLKSSSYSKQPISVGQWLDYSNATPSHNTKKRTRDRAMSLTAPKPPQTDTESAESEAAKLDTLFRSAYSGFAPTRDDAAALVPQGVMSKIWWQRVGEKSFERFVENANIGEDVVATESNDVVTLASEPDEEKSFREAVEWFEAEAANPTLESCVEKSAEEKDVEEILGGISELLETLNSYQRIRHMSLNPAGRPASLLSSTTDAAAMGTPTKPSEPEISTYEILKSQLSLMISSLPPFAVAKLDANRLAELSISTKIPIELENFRGVMQEDEAATKAKAAALSAASTSRVSQPAPLPRPSSTSIYNTQYTPRATPPVSTQYFGTQTPIRPPQSNLQRPPSTAPAPFPAQRPSPAPYRPSSYGTPTYVHQAQRPVQQQYGSHSQQFSGTPPVTGYARPVGQTYQNMPQSAPQAALNQRYPQASYTQQTPTQNGMDYRYGNGSNTGRQPSPQKPMYTPQPSAVQAHLQGRPSYPTQNPALNPNQRPYLQNPMAQNPMAHNPMANGGSSQSPQPQHTPHQPPQPLGPTNYSTFLTTEQQSSMMERQRAQLAQQQAGAQQQARQMAQAAMGSPPKTHVNGSPVPVGL